MTQDNQEQEFLTIEEAAHKLRVKPISVYRMCRRGGATAHGHAIGGTGGSLTVKSVDISLTDSIKYFAVSLCHAVDSASAMIFENPNI